MQGRPEDYLRLSLQALVLAENELDVLLATDRDIPHQRDLSRFDLAPRTGEVRRLLEEFDQTR